jgi:hypothetical protein
LLTIQPAHHTPSHHGGPWLAGRPLRQTSLTICFGRHRFRNGRERRLLRPSDVVKRAHR